MSITWNQRIKHIDRPLNLRERRGLGLLRRLRGIDAARRAGRPPRLISLELMSAKLRLRRQSGQETAEQRAERARLEWRERNERLTWRARAKRRAIAARRGPVKPIWLWRRRREWLEAWEG